MHLVSPSLTMVWSILVRERTTLLHACWYMYWNTEFRLWLWLMRAICKLWGDLKVCLNDSQYHCVLNMICLYCVPNAVGLERLHSLDFSSCKYLSDDGLVHLTAVRDTLAELELSHCPSITHSGLPALYGLHKLQYLGLRDTPGIKHREEAMTTLQRALPHCDIASWPPECVLYSVCSCTYVHAKLRMRKCRNMGGSATSCRK